MPLSPQNLKNGQEQHEYYRAPKRMGKPGPKLCQYDYRYHDGELFSCVAPTLEEARKRRDVWVQAKIDKPTPLTELDRFFA